MSELDLSVLKLTKGSVLVVRGGDLTAYDFDSLRKHLNKMDLGFKVPIIYIQNADSISLATIGEAIEELETIKSEIN